MYSKDSAPFFKASLPMSDVRHCPIVLILLSYLGRDTQWHFVIRCMRDEKGNVVPGIAPRASWVAGSNTTIPMLTAASASWSGPAM
jgi:hypothetical protein